MKYLDYHILVRNILGKNILEKNIRISEWKEIELIQEGDIVYCINGIHYKYYDSIDMYFSNTTDLTNQYENVKRCLECDKRFCVKLISRRKFMYY